MRSIFSVYPSAFPLPGLFQSARVLALLIACLVSAQAVAQAGGAEKTLRVAYLEFPPLSYQAADGTPAGRFIELTRKVVAEAGYQPDFIYLPVSRVYLYLINGTIDVWPGVTEVPRLEGEVLESWVSPFQVQLSAWYREGTEPLEHFDQLQGKRVIVIGGYTYGGLLGWLERKPGIRLTEAPNHRSAVDMLKRNRGDYLLDYQAPVQEILNGGANNIVHESKVRTRNTAWLFSLANPRAAILRNEFDDAYLRLVEKGEVPPVRELTGGYVIPGFPEHLR
ncbi:substrate-binding periplasmic protein [Marinobacter subterrani]|uniref:Amino acid ABC transporter substrate-binding protein, PAAT family n=1 Tax=Marinobacter subterrani TaxID=1658765 RepID=A0A0J7JGQ4_9GAMM|nr:transporter substrate-binding domain-containing protein [Marinobacter subterrani]KMQ76916.1 amino acid ABC transporter substrate-binding protein, PAAT family [Marinobacter subterrani]